MAIAVYLTRQQRQHKWGWEYQFVDANDGRAVPQAVLRVEDDADINLVADGCAELVDAFSAGWPVLGDVTAHMRMIDEMVYHDVA